MLTQLITESLWFWFLFAILCGCAISVEAIARRVSNALRKLCRKSKRIMKWVNS